MKREGLRPRDSTEKDDEDGGRGNFDDVVDARREELGFHRGVADLWGQRAKDRRDRMRKEKGQRTDANICGA